MIFLNIYNVIGTCLPLTRRGGGGIRNEEALKEPGVIGTADKLVYVEACFTDWQSSC